MKEQIYTIPINEAFDEYDGCPLCRLRKKLEANSLNYIMGAAMMEPDVRIMTNKLGFCRTHFHKMLSMGNRLSMALTLESHLDSVLSKLPENAPEKVGRLAKIRKFDGDSPAEAMLQQAGSCFVCRRASEFEKQYVSNIIYIWKKDEAFRQKLKQQPYFCLEHSGALLEHAKANLTAENYIVFSSVMIDLCRTRLAKLRTDITAFCRSFDHENAGKPLDEDTKKAVEAAVSFLSGDFE